jgi:hypothetical protein
MRRRFLRAVGGLIVVVGSVFTVSAPIASQTPAGGSRGQSWTVDRTPWRDPDFQGMWTNFDDTPFEQPNPDPAAAAVEEAVRAKRYGGAGDAPRPWNAHDSPISPKRPSMVVDPPNGRIPTVPGRVSYRDYDHLEDSWEYHIPMERCITRGVPGEMFPYAYNNGYQILQIPGYVVIVPEMIHDARIIPVDGRPHVGHAIRQWNGDSRGRWDGSTLVVETTNFNGKGHVGSGGAVISMRQSETLRVVERFTRVAANKIDYEVTIEDPHVFTKAWKAALPFNLDPTYQMYEYACHEGNTRYMESTLKRGRAAEWSAR